MWKKLLLKASEVTPVNLYVHTVNHTCCVSHACSMLPCCYFSPPSITLTRLNMTVWPPCTCCRTTSQPTGSPPSTLPSAETHPEAKAYSSLYISAVPITCHCV